MKGLPYHLPTKLPTFLKYCTLQGCPTLSLGPGERTKNQYNRKDRGTSSKETPLAPSNNTSDPGSQPNNVASHFGQLKVSQPLPIQHNLNQEKGIGCTHLGLKTSQNVKWPLLRRLKTFAQGGFSPGHSFGKVTPCIAVELREWTLFLTLRFRRKMFVLCHLVESASSRRVGWRHCMGR